MAPILISVRGRLPSAHPERHAAPANLGRKNTKKCIGQKDVAQFQPAKAGFVAVAEGFSPAGSVQHLVDQYEKTLKNLL